MMDNLPEPKTSFWVLHLAAGESKMLVHSGRVTGTDPSHPLNDGEKQSPLVCVNRTPENVF